MTSTTAATATSAYQARRRRRAAHGALDSAMDALMAFGGLLFANAAFGMQLGFLEGRLGMALGLAMFALGVGLVRRGRRPIRREPLVPVARANVMPVPARMVLDADWEFAEAA